MTKEQAVTLLRDGTYVFTDQELKAIADMLDAKTPPPGHILDDGGVVRKVLGEFKLTDDGAIACEEGTCWCVFKHDKEDDSEPWRISECRRTGRCDDYGCWWQVDACEDDRVDLLGIWSTRELAEAARAKA